MPEIVAKSIEQKQSEAVVEGFRKDLGPFVVAAEMTRIAIVFTDAKVPGNPIIFANDSFLKLTGYERAEVLGQDFNFLLERGENRSSAAKIDAGFAGDQQSRLEICDHRKDGSRFWAAIFINPVRDESGQIIQHCTSLMDVTAHKQEEEHLRFLLDELNHRTQNTLATVQAIAVQTLRGAADQGLADAFEGRIIALSKAHSLLGNENWQGASLRQLIERIVQPFGLNDRHASRFSLEGTDIRLSPKAALTLAMVFNELAANAVKYGALSQDGPGRIDISWTIEQSPAGARMQLRWQEGGGPPPPPPGRTGFGLRLIKGLTREVGGDVRLDFDPAGLGCRIDLIVAQRSSGQT